MTERGKIKKSARFFPKKKMLVPNKAVLKVTALTMASISCKLT